MKRAWLVLLAAGCLGCAAAATPAAAPPIEIARDAEQVPVWQGARIVTSPDRALTPQQAAQLAAGSGAKSVVGPNEVLGRASDPYWVLFSLRNPEATDLLRLLALESTTQDDVRLYERLETGGWRQLKSQAELADGRFGGGTAFPVWTLRLEPQRSSEWLLRIEGPAIVRVPLFVYQPLRFAERERRIHVAIGIALGSCLVMGIYVATLRRYLDDRSTSLFLCILIADLVGALWLSGFLASQFPGVPERVLSSIGFAAYATLIGSGCLHARIYLNSAAWAPASDRLLHVLGWLWLGLAPWFPLIFPVAARVLLVTGGALIALILVVVSSRATRRGIPFSGFIATAWFCYLFVGASFLFARLAGNLLAWTSNALVLTQATVVALLFGFAMSQRMLRQRDVLVATRQEAVMQHEKVAALMRERSLLFAATNHDLRQPLLGVSLFANLLRSATAPAEREERAHKLEMALSEVDDLLVGIQQLAAVHEVDRPPPATTIGLDDLLAPLIEEYRGRAEFKRITIRYVPSRLTVTTHVPYFQRIVRNVLANAIRYSDRGDRVLVGCRRSGGLRLVIRDSGRGMTEEQTRRAFEAFQRFDPEMSIPDGFGLGLFSTKSLANALKLAVGLRSNRGRGIEFSIELPRPISASIST